MRARLPDLAKESRPDSEIARILTKEGHRSASRADKVLLATVQPIQLAESIKAPPSRGRRKHDPGFLGTTELAARLGIPVNWLYVQIKKKRLLIDPRPTGSCLYPDTSAVLDGVQNLPNHVIGELDLRICQPDDGGYQHG